jgi:DNA-binding transcriptional ArsR family regulator
MQPAGSKPEGLPFLSCAMSSRHLQPPTLFLSECIPFTEVMAIPLMECVPGMFRGRCLSDFLLRRIKYRDSIHKSYYIANNLRGGRPTMSSGTTSNRQPQMRGIPQLRAKLLLVLLRTGRLSLRVIDWRLKDPVTELVVEALLCKGAASVSEISRYVRSAKGSSSRKTVRKRLLWLEEEGIVCRDNDGRYWMLRESFVRRWLTFVLGDFHQSGEPHM